MTPRRSCSADSDAILLYAPRSLNENTCGAARPGSEQLQPQHAARSMTLARRTGRMLPVFKSCHLQDSYARAASQALSIKVSRNKALSSRAGIHLLRHVHLCTAPECRPRSN